MSPSVHRRSFLTLLGTSASASAWPLPARAQQRERRRRVGVLLPAPEDDQQQQLGIAAFQQVLAKLGWTDGRNVQIDYRWGALDLLRMRAFAAELVGLGPDVLFAGNTPTLAALRQATRSIPIVFTLVSDPIGGGFVASLARPGGNITGFLTVEPPMSGKWIQLLKGIAPQVKRAALLFNPEVAPYAGEFFRYAEIAAVPLAVELIAAAVRDEMEITGVFATLAREQNAGLIVMPDTFTRSHRERIVSLAAGHRIPAVYAEGHNATRGGLISYGVNIIELYRQVASYIDRILRGEMPANLPVQAPTRFELVINLKAAKALGLNVSPDMLSIADEIIE